MPSITNYINGVWKENHPTEGHYYYQCGSQIDKGSRLEGIAYTGEVHCTKSDVEFKNLDKPEDYGKITQIILSKATAERKMATGVESVALPITVVGGPAAAIGLVAAASAYAGAETGETRILTDELGTSNYFILQDTVK